MGDWRTQLWNTRVINPKKPYCIRLLMSIIQKFLAALSESDKSLPKYVQDEFEAYLKCGRLEYGFLRVQCEICHHELLVAFSCKRRGFCPSCGAKRMVESTVLLVDTVLPHQPIRQWVLSVPFQLRSAVRSRIRHSSTSSSLSIPEESLKNKQAIAARIVNALDLWMDINRTKNIILAIENGRNS